jgi:hypothetical protein
MSTGDTEPPLPIRRGFEGRRFIAGARLVLFFVRPQYESSILRLWDTEVLTTGGRPLELGVRGIRAILADLCSMAGEEGFGRIVISGLRIGGANRGRDIE